MAFLVSDGLLRGSRETCVWVAGAGSLGSLAHVADRLMLADVFCFLSALLGSVEERGSPASPHEGWDQRAVL